jgi:hypothetical protein
VKALRFRDVALFQHAAVDVAHLSKQQRRDVRLEADLCAAARFLRAPAQSRMAATSCSQMGNDIVGGQPQSLHDPHNMAGAAPGHDQCWAVSLA